MNAGFLFPFTDSDRIENPLEEKNIYYFPEENESYVLGGNPGREEIHIVGAVKRLEQLETFLNRPEQFNVEAMNDFVNSIAKGDREKNKKNIYLHSIYYNLVE